MKLSKRFFYIFIIQTSYVTEGRNYCKTGNKIYKQGYLRQKQNE